MSNNFEYITLSELMTTITSDLHLYDDNGFIDQDKLVTTIRNCNAKLGYRVYKQKEVTLDVIDFKANLPYDLFKIDTLLGIFDYVKDISPVLRGKGVHFDNHIPLGNKLITDREDFCNLHCNGTCVYVTEKRQDTDTFMKYSKIRPLKLSEHCSKITTDYCPNNSWKSSIDTVDLVDNQLVTSFRDGKLYLCYLADLINKDGEILIPKDDLLYSYYEWSAKAKILENILMNSEADVVEKYKLAESKKSAAYSDAVNYISTSYSGQYENLIKNRREQIYNSYYKMWK